MDDNEYYPLGHLGGAEVGVQPTLDGQIFSSGTVTWASAWPACWPWARRTPSGKKAPILACLSV